MVAVARQMIEVNGGLVGFVLTHLGVTLILYPLGDCYSSWNVR